MRHFRTLIAGLVLLVTACKDKAVPESQPASFQAEAVPKATSDIPSAQPAFSAPDTFKAALGKVFEGYARIQAALAQDDLEKAKEAFSSMHAVLHMMPVDRLDSSARAYWDSTDARIMAILHPMAAVTTLDSIRIHFMDFTQVLADAIGKLGIAGTGPVYRFHCPMAKKNQGADWLQKDTTLANPYFGKSMQTCGERIRKIQG